MLYLLTTTTKELTYMSLKTKFKDALIKKPKGGNSAQKNSWPGTTPRANAKVDQVITQKGK